MCGRFGLTPTSRELEEYFGVADVEDFPPRYNIAPTQPILMVMAAQRYKEGSNLPPRRSLLVRWGLLPGFVKDPKTFPLTINVRSETAAERGASKAAMRYRRALVPASGFFEWRKLGQKERQAFWVRPRDQGIVAFAGLMETWLEAGGSEIDTGAILTTAANDDVKHIHDRMPVVIKLEDFERWLDCRANEPNDVADLMRPADLGYFEAIPVSGKVNNHANVGPENIEPIELPAQQEPATAKPAEAETQLKLF
jgi:putative SOS response-associated peptidase YedK